VRRENCRQGPRSGIDPADDARLEGTFGSLTVGGGVIGGAGAHSGSIDAVIKSEGDRRARQPDPGRRQSRRLAHAGFLRQRAARGFGLAENETYQVHDLLTDARYLWTGRRNFVRLDPQVHPAHVFRIRRKAGSEQNFDVFL